MLNCVVEVIQIPLKGSNRSFAYSRCSRDCWAQCYSIFTVVSEAQRKERLWASVSFCTSLHLYISRLDTGNRGRFPIRVCLAIKHNFPLLTSIDRVYIAGCNLIYTLRCLTSRLILTTYIMVRVSPRWTLSGGITVKGSDWQGCSASSFLRMYAQNFEPIGVVWTCVIS